MEHPIWSYFFPSPREKATLLKLLGTLPVFEGLTSREYVLIERLLHQRHYKKGEAVFYEEEPGAAMYIVEHGEIEITRRSGESGTLSLAMIGDSGFFGEIALLDEIPRSASAHATCDTDLLAFSKPDLEKLIERNPRLGAKILGNLSRLICRRLIKANENLETVQKRLEQETGKGEGES
jgi:CRP-like cAMP-binding protein